MVPCSLVARIKILLSFLRKNCSAVVFTYVRAYQNCSIYLNKGDTVHVTIYLHSIEKPYKILLFDKKIVFSIIIIFSEDIPLLL